MIHCDLLFFMLVVGPLVVLLFTFFMLVVTCETLILRFTFFMLVVGP